MSNLPKISFRVQQGIIHLNSIRVQTYTPECLVLSVDCRAKYSVIINHLDEGAILFDLGEHTLFSEAQRTEPTVLTIRNLGLWIAGVDTRTFSRSGRYSHDITLVKINRVGLMDYYWDDEMQSD